MMYDPTADTYHLHYQWHPNHVNWGNISWGYVSLLYSTETDLTNIDMPHPKT